MGDGSCSAGFRRRRRAPVGGLEVPQMLKHFCFSDVTIFNCAIQFLELHAILLRTAQFVYCCALKKLGEQTEEQRMADIMSCIVCSGVDSGDSGRSTPIKKNWCLRNFSLTLLAYTNDAKSIKMYRFACKISQISRGNCREHTLHRPLPLGALRI